MALTSSPSVLSGEFTIRPGVRPGLWDASVIGNDEADDIGEGSGTTPELALTRAVGDYMGACGDRGQARRS